MSSNLCPVHASEVYERIVAKAARYRVMESAAIADGNESHAAHWRCFAEEHERVALRYASLHLVRS